MTERQPITITAGGVTISLDVDVLRPLIAEIVGQVQAESDADGRIALREDEAAAAIGVPKWRLRDARLRGEIRAGGCGKAKLYSRRELLRLVEGRGNDDD